MLVIADDVVGVTCIEYRMRGATNGNLRDLITQPVFRPSSPSSFQAFAQRLSHRLGFSLPGQLCERRCKLFGLLVADVERHVFTTCRQ